MTDQHADWYEEALNGTLIQTADGIFLKTFRGWDRLVSAPYGVVLKSKEIAEQGPPDEVLRYGWSENDD